ncbi:MAG: hypothetical protein ACOX71_04435 [Lachnospiraceae bacterium]
MRYKRIIAGVVSAAAAASLIVTGYSVKRTEAQEIEEREKQEAVLENTVMAAAGEQIDTSAPGGVDKDEKVYVIMDADGNTQKVEVSDHLINSGNSEKIKDRTDLIDPENTNGDETFTQNGNDLEWNAGGNDIYYSGTTQKEVPADVKISYELDGKSITADELAGKSGRVKIRFDYQNHLKTTVEEDGEKTEVYVPFVMVSGMILDPEKFSNVEVSNGKVISEGKYQIAVGYGMPGLEESLGIGDAVFSDSGEKIEYPDYFEVTSDVTDFELGMTMTFAFSDLLKDIDIDNIDLSGTDKDIDDLESGTQELLDGTSKLMDGSETLSEAMGTAKGGTEELSAGVSALVDGLTGTLPNAIQSSIDEYSGAADGIEEAQNELNSGINKMMNDAVSAGAANAASQTAGIIKNALAEPVSTVKKDIGTIASVMAQAGQTQTFDIAVSGGTQTYLNREDLSEVEVETYSIEQRSYHVLTDEQYQAIMQALSEASGVNMDPDPNEILSGIDQTAVSAAAAEAAAEDQAQIAASAASLAGKAGAQGAVTALRSVKNTMQSKFDTASLMKLKEGAQTLAGGADEIYDGSEELLEGAAELHEGMVKYSEEGIDKLLDLYRGDIKGLISRLKAIKQAGEEYKIFSDLADGVGGSVRFIYKTGEIKSDD